MGAAPVIAKGNARPGANVRRLWITGNAGDRILV